MSDDGKWFLSFIFLLLSVALAVWIFTIRSLVRRCSLQCPDPDERWEQFPSENVARNQRGDAPPEFSEALSMKSPIAYIDIDEIQPPSYEEYVRRHSTDSILQKNSLQLGVFNNNRIPECQLNNDITPRKTNDDIHIDCDSLTENLTKIDHLS